MKYLPFRMLDLIAALTKVLTGAEGVWSGLLPSKKQRIYFANHTSNLDTIVIWSSLPSYLRALTRPVAAKDYWNQPGIRRHIAIKELNVVFVERNKETRTEDPLNPLREALNQGYSLIIFPEGKRNPDVIPGEFKSGIYRLFQEYPEVEFVPVYLENVAKTFPRGAFLPLPINCKAIFGKPVDRQFDNNQTMMDNKNQDSLDSKTMHYQTTIFDNIIEVNDNAIPTTPHSIDASTLAKLQTDNFLNAARQSIIDLIPSYIKYGINNLEEKIEAGKRKIFLEEENKQ